LESVGPVTTARVRNGKVRIPHQYGYRFRIIRFAVVVFCMLFLLHHFYPAFNVPVVPGISCASGVRNALPEEGVAPAGGIEGGAYATGKALRDLSEGPPNPDDVKDTLLSGAAVAGKFAGGVRAAWDGAAAPLKTPEVEPAPVEGSGTTDVATGGPCSPCGGVNALPATGPALPGLTGEQSRNAYVIMRTGQSMRVPTKGLVVALAAASQESGLRNLRYGMQDSQGLFQMRPSMGWGTVAQVTSPAYASRKFFTVLSGVRGWQLMSVTEAAQAVERSGFPGAYAKWEPRAWSVVKAATSGSRVRAASFTAAGAGVAVVDGISSIAARQLALAERMSGVDMRVMQGGYGGDHIAASGSSHNYPGVMDVSPGTIQVETVLRRVGFAAWARNIPGRSTAGSGAHVHAVSLLDPGDKTSPQVYGSWAHHGNGLSGANNDPAAHVALVPGLSSTGGCGGGSSTPVVTVAEGQAR
jgi:hypothetical protein